MRQSLMSGSFVLFLITAPISVKAQGTVPNSYVNLGIGLGMNYGGIGVKGVIGYRNSGLLIGVGAIPSGIVGYEIGGQISIGAFYANLGYGILGTYQLNDGPVEPIKSMSFLVGGMINVGKTEDAFIDIGVGHSIGAPTTQIGPFEENQSAFVFAVGVGFRLAKKKASN